MPRYVEKNEFLETNFLFAFSVALCLNFATIMVRKDFLSVKNLYFAILLKNARNVVLEPRHPLRCLDSAAYSGGLKHNSLYDPFSEDLSCLVSSQVASSGLNPGRKQETGSGEQIGNLIN